MNKQDYVLKLLDKLLPYWDEAAIIKEHILTHGNEYGYVDFFYEKGTAAVDAALKSNEQDKLGAVANYLGQLHAAEDESRAIDEKDIENLDTLLAQM